MARYPAWRWLVLFAFAVNSASNAFMCMDFSAVAATTQAHFHIDTNQLNLLYTILLIAVLPATIVVVPQLERRNYATTAAGVACNCGAAVLRWVAAARRSYGVALASSVLAGFSAAVIISSVAHIGEAWFPPGQRTLAMSLGVQANYFGWCVGGVVVPHAITGGASFVAFQKWQAVVICVLCGGTFLAFHRARPAAAAAAAAQRAPPPHSYDEAATSVAAALPRIGARLHHTCYCSGGGGEETLTVLEVVAIAPAEEQEKLQEVEERPSADEVRAAWRCVGGSDGGGDAVAAFGVGPTNTVLAKELEKIIEVKETTRMAGLWCCG